MSRREVARAVVLGRVKAGELTLREGTPLLGVSYRQAKRLYARYQMEGSAGLVHRGVGKASNHRRSAAEKSQVLELVASLYGGSVKRGPGQRFGPTLASEHLSSDHGLIVPVSTLRGWMKESGLWTRVRKHRPGPRRRERRAHFGELVQLDGSFHDWYEGRGKRSGRRSCMMNMVDDATSCTLLRFGDEETIWAAADILMAWIAKYGVPWALYTDWKNVYKRQPTAQEEREGIVPRTHFGRMCEKLGIEIIAANTPQAKGRVERSNGIQQDRLIKKMRLRHIDNDADANVFAETEYLPQQNARFAICPASPVDYHRPRDPGLADRDVFCLDHSRVVSNDFVVQFGRQALQLSAKVRGRLPARSRVIVREERNGRLRIIHVSRRGLEREYDWTPAARTPKGASPQAVTPSPPQASRRHKPAPDHPFRKANGLGVGRARVLQSGGY